MVTVFFGKESSDDAGTGVVNEGLAGGLDESVEEGAELFLYEVGHVFAVVTHVVLHYS